MKTDMILECHEILKLLKNEFDSLWSCKKRGETIEVVTPFVTITQNFISIFITKRNGAYIVSDGGWVQEHIQERIGDDFDNGMDKILNYFANHYKIGIHKEGEKKFFYKSHADIKMLSAMSYDIAQFISNTVNTMYSTYEIEMLEYVHSQRFDTQVNEILKQRFEGKYEYHTNYPALSDLKTVRFSAYVSCQGKNRFTLIMHITGATPTYFANSVGRANQNFEVAKKSKFYGYSNRLSIINDKADGYKTKNDFGIYLDNLQDKSQIIDWSNFDYNKFMELLAS